MEANTIERNLEFLEESISHIREDIDQIDKNITLIKKTVSKSSVEKEFKQKYPSLGLDKKLNALVGTQPVTSLPEEKKMIRRIMQQKFS